MDLTIDMPDSNGNLMNLLTSFHSLFHHLLTTVPGFEHDTYSLRFLVIIFCIFRFLTQDGFFNVKECNLLAQLSDVHHLALNLPLHSYCLGLGQHPHCGFHSSHYWMMTGTNSV